MIAFNPVSPPNDLEPSYATFGALLSLLADPETAQARLTEMRSASAELRNAVSSWQAEQATYQRAKIEHQKALDKATADHAEQMKSERVSFERDVAKTKREQDSTANQLARLQEKLKTDTEAVATARADLERRLALVKEAAGSSPTLAAA